MDSLLGQARARGRVESHPMQPSLHLEALSLAEGREGLREPQVGKWAVTPTHRVEASRGGITGAGL